MTSRLRWALVLVAVCVAAVGAQPIFRVHPSLPLTTLLDAESVDETSEAIAISQQSEDVTVFVECGASVSAGVVTIEECHSASCSGTWSVTDTVTCGAENTHVAVHLNGVVLAVRTRISTAISGGTVTTRVVAR